MTVALLPKGGSYYCGIGLLELFWKAVEILIDKRMKVVEFHDNLHGFLEGRGTGTATKEAKPAQQLAYIEQAPFYGIFLDLQKAYDSMDRDRCLHISKVYGVGPNTPWLIKYFWDEAVLVCQVSGYYGEPFSADYGAT